MHLMKVGRYLKNICLLFMKYVCNSITNAKQGYLKILYFNTRPMINISVNDH